jgi:hypothetical protein
MSEVRLINVPDMITKNDYYRQGAIYFITLHAILSYQHPPKNAYGNMSEVRWMNIVTSKLEHSLKRKGKKIIKLEFRINSSKPVIAYVHGNRKKRWMER